MTIQHSMKMNISQERNVDWRLLKLIAILLLIFTYGALFSSCKVDEEQKVAVTETKPIINFFDAYPPEIVQGKSVNLRWSVTNADTVEIKPDIGNVASSGSINVYPDNDLQYTLTAKNSAGISSATVSINVTPPATKSKCINFGCDAVSGRNQDITLKWEQLCLCTEYRIQIAKDTAFNMIIYDRNNYIPSDSTSPGLIYLAGGILNCGQTYYVRVQCLATATGQHILTPWSATGCITIGAGFPISNPHQ